MTKLLKVKQMKMKTAYMKINSKFKILIKTIILYK